MTSVYATGHRAEAHLARLARLLARSGQGVLVLDEQPRGEGSGPDLLHALDGRVVLADLRQDQGYGVWRVPVAVAAPAFPLLDGERRQRLLQLLEQLHRRVGHVLVRAAAAGRPSPFTWAAPHRLLVAEASGRGATEAYAAIKGLVAAGAGSLRVVVAGAKGRDDGARFFAGLEDLVRRHVGLPLAWLGELERDDLAAALALPATPSSPRETEWAFLRRLQAWGRGVQLANGLS